MYRILLAEDDRVMCRSLSEGLRQEGYEVVAVGDGRSAVEMFGRRSFDLALLDVCMPVMDGLAASRAIRLTHVEGLKAGADDYMDKTISPEEMRLRIRRALYRPDACRLRLRGQ